MLPSLIKMHDLSIIRTTSQGDYSDTTGLWIPPSTENITVKASVQPLRVARTVVETESNHTQSWLSVWSSSELRKDKEGENGWICDKFVWEGYTYKIMEVSPWRAGFMDYHYAKAVMESYTPTGTDLND